MAISVTKNVLPHGMMLYKTLLCISMIAAGCAGHKDTEVPYYKDASFTPLWQPGRAQLDSVPVIAPFSFINQYGDTVTEKTVKGNIYLANFFYTSCPGICPKMTRTMLQVYKIFEGNKNVLFLSHSVLPAEDSIARLRDYARLYGVSGRQWHFVTGNAAEIYALARKSYFVEEEPGLRKDSSVFLHTENMVLVDGSGHIRGLYNGTLEAEVPRISADIRALLKEKESAAF